MKVEQALLSMLDPCNRTWQPGIELTSRDWETMQMMVRQHRLGPLLHWRLARNTTSLNVPQRFLDDIAASFRKRAARSLQLQYEIVRTHRLLRGCGINAVFLKGAFLAFHVYPHAALRPMRDLDVLVPRDRAMDAFDALVTAGFTRTAYSSGDPSAAVDCKKHLPVLESPSGRVAIELHTRLIEPQDHSAKRPEPADDPAVWQRLIYREIAGEQIAFLSSADQLLHLIVHAVVDHRLGCGPLVLTDIAGLVQQTDIHWPIFWRMAAECGWIRECTLLLHVTDRFCGPLSFVSPTLIDLPQLPEGLLTTTAVLMLGDLEHHADIGLSAFLQAQSVTERMRMLLKRIFPSRQFLATIGAEARSPLLKHNPYLAHWWRLITTRAPQYFASGRGHRAACQRAELAKLNRWLAQ